VSTRAVCGILSAVFEHGHYTNLIFTSSQHIVALVQLCYNSRVMAHPNMLPSPEFSQPPASPEELVSLYKSAAKYVDPSDLLGRSHISHPGSDLPVFSEQPIVDVVLPTESIIQQFPEAAKHLNIGPEDSVELEYAKVGFLLGAGNYAHPMDGYVAVTISRSDPEATTPADSFMFDMSAETGEPKDSRHTTELHETMERVLHDYTPVGEHVAPDAPDPVEELLGAKAKSEDERNVPLIGSLDAMALQQIIEKLGSGEAWTSAA